MTDEIDSPTTGQKTPLDIFIPEDRRQAISMGKTLPTRSHGAVLFADISGFTALTNILSTELGPKRGAEELIRQLDPIYTELVQAIHNYRGSVIVISGDGITCWFDQDNGRRAASCAFRMQEIMARYETIRLPTGQTISLGMKITLSVGAVQRFLVGDPDIQLIEAIAGHVLDEVVAAQQLLARGDIAVDGRLLSEIETEVILRAWVTTADGSRFAILEERAQLAAEDPWPEIPDLDHTLARRWVFSSVYNRIRAEEIEFLTELRHGVPMFLKFTGLDYDNDGQAGEKLDRFIRRVQGVLMHYEGYLCQLTIGDKGSNLFIAFGAPIAHEDDINRALAAALLLRDQTAELGFIEPIQISLTYGQLWAGAHGGKRARTYSVMGAEVNLAARLMGHAQPGQILVSPHIVEATLNYSFAPLSPIDLKGVEKPLIPFLLVGKTRAYSVPVQQKSMFGREFEQGILMQNLQALTNNGSSRSAGTILIEGEAGIGKSLLLADFVEKANQMGLKTFTGYGDPVERATPYHGVRPVFESLFGISEEDDFSTNQQKVLSAIQENPFLIDRLPLLSEVIPLRLQDNDLTREMKGEARATSIREFLLEVLRHLLFQGKGHGPAIVILDDAQWLDSATWNLTGYLHRDLPQLQLAIGMRSVEDAELGEHNEEEYRRLRADPRTKYIRLQVLVEEEIVGLIGRKLGVKSLPAYVLRFIQARAQGNPFFSEEIAYALRDSGLIQVENGEVITRLGADELDRIDFPRTIQGVITSRIDRLPPAHQLTLKVASVIGRAFLLNMLSNIHPSRIKVSTLVDYLTALTQIGITELETMTPELSYLFKHIITQEVVYNLLTFAQRKQLHCAIGEWYEINYADDLAPYYPRLAHHWLKGEVRDKAIHYLDKAAEQALELYSNEDVIRFLSLALDLMEKKPEQEIRGRRGFAERLQRARWERMLGMAHSGLGHLPEAQGHLSRALELLGRRIPGSKSGLTLNLINEIFVQIGHRLFPGQLNKPLSTQERAILEELAKVDIEYVFYYSQNNTLILWGILRRLNIAERLGMPHLMAQGYSNIELMTGLASLDRVYRHYHRLTLEAVQKADRISTRIYPLHRQAIVFFIQGDWEKADRDFETVMELAAQLGDTSQWAISVATLATSLYLQAKFDRALQHWNALCQKVAPTEELHTRAFSLYGQGHNLLMLGQLEESIRALEASIRVPMKNTDDKILATSRHGALSLAYLRLGDFNHALENVLRHQELAPRAPAISSLMNEYDGVFDAIFGLWKNIQQGIYAPTATQSAQLRQALLRIPRTLKGLRRPPVNRAKIKLYEGIYRSLMGDDSHAVEQWKQCIDLAEEYHQPYELGRARLELGLHLESSERAGHLEAACRIFTELQTPYELNLARKALAAATSVSRD